MTVSASFPAAPNSNEPDTPADVPLRSSFTATVTPSNKEELSAVSMSMSPALLRKVTVHSGALLEALFETDTSPTEEMASMATRTYHEKMGSEDGDRRMLRHSLIFAT